MGRSAGGFLALGAADAFLVGGGIAWGFGGAAGLFAACIDKGTFTDFVVLEIGLGVNSAGVNAYSIHRLILPFVD